MEADGALMVLHGGVLCGGAMGGRLASRPRVSGILRRMTHTQGTLELDSCQGRVNMPQKEDLAP